MISYNLLRSRRIFLVQQLTLKIMQNQVLNKIYSLTNKTLFINIALSVHLFEDDFEVARKRQVGIN